MDKENLDFIRDQLLKIIMPRFNGCNVKIGIFRQEIKRNA